MKNRRKTFPSGYCASSRGWGSSPDLLPLGLLLLEPLELLLFLGALLPPFVDVLLQLLVQLTLLGLLPGLQEVAVSPAIGFMSTVEPSKVPHQHIWVHYFYTWV
jgi:hypothetical protein